MLAPYCLVDNVSLDQCPIHELPSVQHISCDTIQYSSNNIRQMPQTAHWNILHRATIHSSLANAPGSSLEYPLHNHTPFFFGKCPIQLTGTSFTQPQSILLWQMPQAAHWNILYTTTIHSSLANAPESSLEHPL